MIPSSQEILYRIYGAWRLARFDAGGAQFFDDAPDAAIRSFFAAVLVAPAYTVLLLLRADSGSDVEPLLQVLVYALTFSLDWTVFPVVTHRICQLIDRERAFFRYLSAKNWASMIAYHLLLVLTILAVGGVIPAALLPVAILGFRAYLLGYLWFITRHCLDVSAPAAIGFTALNFFIELFLYAIVSGLLY